jgi:hypothetical protein
MNRQALSGVVFVVALLSAAHAAAQTLPLAGSVVHEKKVSQTEGGFTGVLTGGSDPYTDPGDLFGISVTPIGDLDHDGVVDLAVGAYCDDEGGILTGAIWILFMNADQTVRTQQKISKYSGNFAGPIHKGDLFGWSLGYLGDLDADGAPELAVGSWLDDDGVDDAGAVWILSLNPDGTVKHQAKISATQGGFGGHLEPGERFGTSLVNLGDVDGDGVNDMAVGAVYDMQGGHFVGCEWILFLNPDATVKSWVQITNGFGGFTGFIDTYSRFGYSACVVRDLDGDGVNELAVGAITETPNWTDYPHLHFNCHTECGAVWILFLGHDGQVKAYRKIAESFGGLTASFNDHENFAHGVCSPGDLDGDGVQDLVVGAVGDAGDVGGGPVTGLLWVLFLKPDGSVKSYRQIDALQGGFTGSLDVGDFFGQSLAALGDLDGDGIGDFAVGAIGDDDGGADKGAFWFLYPYGASWSEAAAGTNGTQGVPKLSVSSSLKADKSVVLRLERAAPVTLAMLLVSGASAPVPLKGGMLVPAVNGALMLPLITDRSGQIEADGAWPSGVPAGTKLYLQTWIKDASATGGTASSNAIVGTTP